jgi:hypothetical protein
MFDRVDTFILETHARLIGEEKNGEMLGKLADLGFQIIDQDSFVVVMRRNAQSSSKNEGVSTLL